MTTTTVDDVRPTGPNVVDRCGLAQRDAESARVHPPKMQDTGAALDGSELNSRLRSSVAVLVAAKIRATVDLVQADFTAGLSRRQSFGVELADSVVALDYLIFLRVFDRCRLSCDGVACDSRGVASHVVVSA
ncbi:hypothetical protein [Antrihabitans spumae]|uniref:Uncharacterized protein n=1 Tax=Antrihabitans spumae TaxID=3373370 RepID=A0ABW7KVZ6_9NOCA